MSTTVSYCGCLILAVGCMLGPVSLCGAAPEDGTAVALLAQQLKHRDAAMRLKAAQAIRARGVAAKGAIPALTTALADEDRLVREIAALALSNFGPEARTALPALLKA